MICAKDLSITIGGDFQYFPMEEAGAGDRVDVIQGAHLVPQNFGGAVAQVAGKVAFGAELSGGTVFLNETISAGLTYDITKGITLAGWFNYSGLVSGDGIGIGWRENGAVDDMAFLGYFDLGGFLLTVPFPNSTAAIPTPLAGVWHFFILDYDPNTGLLSIEFDRNGVVSTLVSGSYADGVKLDIIISLDGAGAVTVAVDEILFIGQILTVAQRDYLWNGGAGRTVPITLP